VAGRRAGACITPGIFALVAIAVFLGHLYPVFLGFKGGKGVATALGVLAAISGWLALAVVVTWLLMAVISRYSSLSALVAAFCAPLFYVLGSGMAWYAHTHITLAIVVITALLFYRHAANISRLIKGTESRIGSKKK